MKVLSSLSGQLEALCLSDDPKPVLPGELVRAGKSLFVGNGHGFRPYQFPKRFLRRSNLRLNRNAFWLPRAFNQTGGDSKAPGSTLVDGKVAWRNCYSGDFAGDRAGITTQFLYCDPRRQ